jgi:hypothetical protein
MFAPFDEIEAELGSVELTMPPPDTGSVIRDAVASLGPDDMAALMGTATSDGTVKAALVVRTDNGWSAVAWFARLDGQNVGGVGILKTWKR